MLFAGFLIVGCQQDDISDQQGIARPSRFSKLSFEQLPDDFKSQKFAAKIRNLSRHSLEKNGTDHGLTINIDEIGLFDNGNEKTFTFGVQPDSITTSFYNLIVRTDSVYTILNTDLLEYAPSAQWLLEPTRSFTGVVYLNSTEGLNDEVYSILTSLNYKSIRQCAIGVSFEWECNDGYPHSPADNVPGGICRVGGNEFYINIQYGPCSGGSSGNTDDTRSYLRVDGTAGGGIGDAGNDNQSTTCNPSYDLDCGNATIPIPVDLPVSVDEDTQNFFDSLEDELEEYINNPDRDELRKEVDDYLKEELHRQEAKDFAEEAIKAKEESEDNEVDFENKSIYDPSVPDCLKEIIDRFKPEEFSGIDFAGIDNRLIQQMSLPNTILELFDNSEKYGLKFEVVDVLIVNGVHANAGAVPPNENGLVKIIFGQDYLNAATDLAIARTVIHELVHAFLHYQVDSNPGSDISQTLSQVIVQTGQNPVTPQHDLMANDFVDAMANALSTWHNSPATDPLVYDHLAWSGGMKNSETFLFKDPVFKSDVDRRDQSESGIIPSPNSAFPLLNQIGVKACN